MTLLERLAELRLHLAHLREIRPRVATAADLDADLSLRNDVLHSLQIVCQVVIGAAGDLAARAGLPFEDYTEAIRCLPRTGRFPSELALALEGCHLAPTAPFQHWADRQRGRLARLHRKARRERVASWSPPAMWRAPSRSPAAGWGSSISLSTVGMRLSSAGVAAALSATGVGGLRPVCSAGRSSPLTQPSKRAAPTSPVGAVGQPAGEMRPSRTPRSKVRTTLPQRV